MLLCFFSCVVVADVFVAADVVVVVVVVVADVVVFVAADVVVGFEVGMITLSKVNFLPQTPEIK